MKRRTFLQTASAASLAALTGNGGRLRAESQAALSKIAPTADTVILLWMAGGMAHAETFDPKNHTPFEKGIKSQDVASTFPTIDTAVDNIKLTAGLENIASVMDKGTLIRSHILGDLGFILHSRHQYHWHTGYEPPLTVAAPHMGAWIAKALGPNNPAIPPFIEVGQPLAGNGEAEELKAFLTGGFLGSEYGPFRVPHAEQAADAVRPPAGMSVDRFRARHKAYLKMVKASPAYREASDFQRESLLRSVERAYTLLDSPASKAFDLSLEPKESYDTYNTGNFGLGCLLARRLTEVGARFIEVSSEYIPFKGWDLHDNGHTRIADQKKYIDAPIANLVRDLDNLGLLDRTLVIVASEFSRNVLVEGKEDKPVQGQVAQPDEITELKQFGHHRHFTDASSVLLFGGGAKRGFLYGRTAEKTPWPAIEDRIHIPALHASIYNAVGIPADYSLEIEERPFYITKDGTGKPEPRLFG